MEYVSTKNAPGAIGPYSQAVKANGLLFTSGQIAINPETNTVEAKTLLLLLRRQELLWIR